MHATTLKQAPFCSLQCFWMICFLQSFGEIIVSSKFSKAIVQGFFFRGLKKSVEKSNAS